MEQNKHETYCQSTLVCYQYQIAFRDLSTKAGQNVLIV